MNKKDFNVFKFKMGRARLSIKEWIKIGAIFHLSLDTISMIPGVEKKKLFNLIDEFQIHIGYTPLNDYIIKDGELIGYRVERVVKKALEKYQKEIDEE
jgi:hypothetical protein